jgi:hypothetical protein
MIDALFRTRVIKGLAATRKIRPVRKCCFVLKGALRSAMRLSAKKALFESGYLDGSFN